MCADYLSCDISGPMMLSDVASMFPLLPGCPPPSNDDKSARSSSSLFIVMFCIPLPSVDVDDYALAVTALEELLRGITRSESPTTSSETVPLEDPCGGCAGDGNGFSGLELSLLDKSSFSRSLAPTGGRKLPSVDLRGIDFSLTRVSSMFVGAETFFSPNNFW
jgi:hypothetical protein